MALTGSVEDIGDGRDGSWVGQVAGALKLSEALQLHMTTPAAGFASSAVGQGQSAASCALGPQPHMLGPFSCSPLHRHRAAGNAPRR